METTRVAVISIIVEKQESVDALNHMLHTYSHYIIGRLGIPYRAKGINIICVAVDAPAEQSDALSGALDLIDGISVSVAYSKN